MAVVEKGLKGAGRANHFPVKIAGQARTAAADMIVAQARRAGGCRTAGAKTDSTGTATPSNAETHFAKDKAFARRK